MAQATEGLANLLVLYEYDFADPAENNPATLNPRGRYQLEKLAAQLHDASFHGIVRPIVIQESRSGTALDEQRRNHVIDALNAISAPVIPGQVVIGRPKAGGITAAESEAIYMNLQTLMRRRGRGVLGGGGGPAAATAIGIPLTTGANGGASR